MVNKERHIKKRPITGCSGPACHLKGYCDLGEQVDNYIYYKGGTKADGSPGGDYHHTGEWREVQKATVAIGEDIGCPNTKEIAELNTQEFERAKTADKLIYAANEVPENVHLPIDPFEESGGTLPA